MTDLHDDGYVKDIEYVAYFDPIFSPATLDFYSWMNKGPVINRNLNQSISYLDVGCGVGYSLNLLASSNPDINFYGIDYNPHHIEIAQEQAENAELTNVKFICCDFEKFLTDYSNKLPDFNYIVCHGVYSWVENKIQDTLKNIFVKKLATNGILYVSYNTMPGWAQKAPLQRMLYEKSLLSSSNSEVKIHEVIQFAKSLKQKENNFFKKNILAGDPVDNFNDKDVNYYAHEYLNRFSTYPYFKDVVNDFNEIGFYYLGNGLINSRRLHIDYYIDPDNFINKNAYETKILKEQFADFILNSSFRMDFYAKKLEDNSNLNYDGYLNCLYLVPCYAPDNFNFDFWCSNENIKQDKNIQIKIKSLFENGIVKYSILFDLLSENIGSFEAGEWIFGAVSFGLLQPANINNFDTSLTFKSNKFNEIIMQKNPYGLTRYIALPASGNGFSLDHSIAIALLTYMREGKQSPDKMVFSMEETLNKREEFLKGIGNDDNNKLKQRSVLAAFAYRFNDITLPWARSVGLVE